MQKKTKHGALKKYPEYHKLGGIKTQQPFFDDFQIDDVNDKRTPVSTEPNLRCDCGCEDFKICWWDYPGSGGYCKLKCAKCGYEHLLMNDYS